jgi:dipeptidyl-peptidase-4
MDALPAQLARTRRFTLGVPDRFTVTPDGSAVLFLRGRGGDDPAACLWALDLDADLGTGTGTPRLLADPASLGGGGIEGYAMARDASLVAFALDGALWTVDASGGPVRRLPVAEPVTDPHPDPLGRRIAYVSGGALRMIGADGGGDRTLAAPDGPDVTFGVGHLGSGGFWWSPDGERLLVARVDSAAVGRWYLTDPSSPGARPRAVRYSAAGTPVAEITLWTMGLDGTRTRARWDADYVPDAGWDANGPYAVVRSRDQRTVRLLGIDPDDGRTTVLSEQRDAC